MMNFLNRIMKYMKVCLLMLPVFLISACMKKNEKLEEAKAVGFQYSGVVFSGYMKACPYGLKTSAGDLGLDAMNIPDGLLDMECKITAEELKEHHQGFNILSKVTINGVRYLTNEEWHVKQDNIHKKDDDPF